MSKVILCAGKTAKKPYILKSSGTRIFTIEELCYCLHRDLDMLEESMIDRELAVFMERELGLPERGQLLARLVDTKADLRSRLVVIFCSADYFDEREISVICDELKKLSEMSEAGRRKRRADRMLYEGHTTESLREYRDLISGKFSGDLSDEEYGAVLHNTAVILAGLGRFGKAGELFLKAYENNNKYESLKSYLYCLQLDGADELYNRELMRLVDNSRAKAMIENDFEDSCEKAAAGGGLSDIERLKNLLREGRISEFDRISKEIIERLKKEYRTNISTVGW